MSGVFVETEGSNCVELSVWTFNISNLDPVSILVYHHPGTPEPHNHYIGKQIDGRCGPVLDGFLHMVICSSSDCVQSNPCPVLLTSAICFFLCAQNASSRFLGFRLTRLSLCCRDRELGLESKNRLDMF